MTSPIVDALLALDPAFITLVVAYEAFVYIAAQIANSSRCRLEDLRVELAKPGSSGRQMRRADLQRAEHDFHHGYALILSFNVWLLVGLVLILFLVPYTMVIDGSYTSNAIAKTAMWSGIMSILCAVNFVVLKRSYLRECRELRLHPWLHFPVVRPTSSIDKLISRCSCGCDHDSNLRPSGCRGGVNRPAEHSGDQASFE